MRRCRRTDKVLFQASDGIPYEDTGNDEEDIDPSNYALEETY